MQLEKSELRRPRSFAFGQLRNALSLLIQPGQDVTLHIATSSHDNRKPINIGCFCGFPALVSEASSLCLIRYGVAWTLSWTQFSKYSRGLAILLPTAKL